MPIGWSSDLAYAVGLITSDGSLSKDGRHIDLTSSDIQQLETFKNVLGLTVKIGTKTNRVSKKMQYRVQFGNVELYRWLETIGLFSNKSKTVSSINVPDDYFADFLRGLFDGDGSIWSFWDVRWRRSYMFYVQFSSASPLFIEWLQSKLQTLYGISGSVRHSSSVLQLCYAKYESIILLKLMYENPNSPRLKRKFTRAIEILEEDPYSSIALGNMRGW
jgi:DNA-binding transcriptional regulator WhiA